MTRSELRWPRSVFRIPLTPEPQLELAKQYGGLDVWGMELIAHHSAAAWAWAGKLPVPVAQAGRLAPRRQGARSPHTRQWPR